MREKRTAIVKTHLAPSTKQQLELFAAESNVVSMSDYLRQVIEEHVAIRAVKQTIGKRIGNQ